MGGQKSNWSFSSALWGKHEKLVYKPQSRLLKAELEYDIRKLDDSTAQVSVRGEFKLPFQAAKGTEWSGQITEGEPQAGEPPVVYMLPILLRSYLQSKPKASDEIQFRVGRSKVFTLRISPEGSSDRYKIDVARTAGEKIDWSRAHSGVISWNTKAGVIETIELEAPIVGKIKINKE